MTSRLRGFTLIELMVVLAVAAVVLSLGVPGFTDFRRNSRMTAVANDFLGSIQSARSEAIKRQVPVAVCPSENPDAEDAECSDGTFVGWIVFVDGDNDCLRDVGDPEQAVVRTGARIDRDASPLTPVSNGVCVSFGANGFLQTIAGRASASRTLFCDARGNTAQAGTALSAARGLEVLRTGRARITRDIDALDTWPVACP